MFDFFISLSGKDKFWADWIAWQLKEAGYSLRYQHWDFQVGQNFELHMEEGVRQARRVLIVVSPNYFDSDYPMEEYTQALNRDPTGRAGTIVPVRVMPCDLRGSRLGSRTYIDLVGLTEPEARQALLNGLKEKGPPPTRPVFPAKNSAPGTPTAPKPNFPAAVVKTLCQPAVGEIAPLLCDRGPQTSNFAWNIVRHQKNAVQIHVIHGEADDLPESLSQRFFHQVLQEEVDLLEDRLPDKGNPDRFEQVPWPLDGDLEKRTWLLVHEIYKNLGVSSCSMVDKELSAQPFLDVESLKSHRFIVLEHYLHASRWDAATADLLKWYRCCFWRPLVGRPGRPRFLILLHVIYPPQHRGLIYKIRRLIGYHSSTLESIEGKLKELFEPHPEAAAGYLLDRLSGVNRIHVERWFQETGLIHCFSFEQRRKHLDQLFGNSEHTERRMACVQAYLQQLLKEFQTR